MLNLNKSLSKISLRVLSLKIALAVVGSLGVHGTVRGESHEYIMMMRSGNQTHVFVSQGVEGNYGSMKRSTSASSTSAAVVPTTTGDSSVWQGYDLKTTIGLELMKFVSFSVGHASVDMRSKDDGQENMRGSKLSGESKLSFISPMGNLEFGGAVTGSRYDYHQSTLSGGYYGSGFYYLLGWNYFMSHRVSVFGNAKIIQEHLVPNGGADTLPTMDTNMTALGGGFSLWL